MKRRRLKAKQMPSTARKTKCCHEKEITMMMIILLSSLWSLLILVHIRVWFAVPDYTVSHSSHVNSVHSASTALLSANKLRRPATPLPWNGENEDNNNNNNNNNNKYKNNMLWSYQDDDFHEQQEEQKTPYKNDSLKYILFYNSYWDFPDYQFGFGHDAFLHANCPVSDCVTTNDHYYFEDDLSLFDAVLFHAGEFNSERYAASFSWRSHHQKFVYVNMESPLSYPDRPQALNFYNWTMTYRQDSDIVRPYGYFSPINNTKNQPENYSHIKTLSIVKDYDANDFFHNVLPRHEKDRTKNDAFLQLAERPKKVAWIVSNCHSFSKRENYVFQLQHYIHVDIFGPCNFASNNNNTTTTKQSYCSCDYKYNDRLHHDNCTSTVARDYKFYLGMENSFCKDYVTEKFFLRMQQKSLVIVLGAANYSAIAPPHSYINAMDYASPQQLGEYLQLLDQNKSLYLSYFWWHDHYQVHSEEHTQAICCLCEMLHQQQQHPSTTIYSNTKEWHSSHSQCYLPDQMKDLPNIATKHPTNTTL